MIITKEQALKTIQDLPAQFEIDELIEKLQFIQAVEEGIQDIRNGNTVTQDEVEAMVKSWQQ